MGRPAGSVKRWRISTYRQAWVTAPLGWTKSLSQDERKVVGRWQRPRVSEDTNEHEAVKGLQQVRMEAGKQGGRTKAGNEACGRMKLSSLSGGEPASPSSTIVRHRSPPSRLPDGAARALRSQRCGLDGARLRCDRTTLI